METCKLPGAKVIQALRKKCSEQAKAASSSVKKMTEAILTRMVSTEK